jgi:hypothetical protein
LLASCAPADEGAGAADCGEAAGADVLAGFVVAVFADGADDASGTGLFGVGDVTGGVAELLSAFAGGCAVLGVDGVCALEFCAFWFL